MPWKYEKTDNIYFKKVKTSDHTTAMIFIHGLGGSRNYWGEIQDSLAEKYVLYFIDLLGFGFSKKPGGEYTLSRHIDAVHKFLLDHVKEKHIILVGHSLGAIIALGYTSKYNGNIAKTYLISLPYFHSSSEARKLISAHSSTSFLYTDTFLAHASCHIVCMFRPLFLFILSLGVRRKNSQLVRDSLYHTHQSYFSTLKNVILQQNLEKLFTKEVRVKIILIHGENDKLVPIANINELVKKFKLSLVTIKDVGHDIVHVHAEKLSTIISESPR